MRAIKARLSSNNGDILCVKPSIGHTGNFEILVTIAVAAVVVALEALWPWVSDWP